MSEEATGPEGEGPLAEQSRRVKSSNLLWFISSRPYVPMADLRRRFGLEADTGTLLHDDEGPVHIGLPRQAAETLLELTRRRKVGLQYDLEYATRIAVGVYPLRLRLTEAPPSGRPQPIAAVPRPPDEEETAEAGAEARRPAGMAPPPPRNRRRRRR